MKFDFTHKVVLVTGASKGIGKETAKRFAAAGALTCLVSRSEEALKTVADEIRSSGGQADVYALDVSSLAGFTEVVTQVVKTHGSVDILVNNAGVTKDNLIMRMKEEDWDKVINVNLKGIFNGIKAVTRPMMKAKHGRIINISSVVGLMGNAGQCNYAAAKAGIFGLTKAVARELASRSITVNAVAPGYIQTEMTEILNENVKQELMKNIPLGRLGTPEDVAHLVMFLASDEAAYITGQTYNVDGGMVMQ
ncbi:MAG: 3-oxoacyl-[acyl-carrier-protein] reductase [FCB group bacterium]|nr:3-oxoacyl-[acyl-carrier-protein] reductase [FCB group bacterium]